MEFAEETRKHLVAVRLGREKPMRARNVRGYFVAYIPGYGDPPEKPDPRLLTILRKSSVRGYYVLANDTTDTGDGFIRFRREEPLVNITDLVDPKIETGDLEREREQTVYDGENSQLPEFQMGAPDFCIVYELLSQEGFPYLDRYYAP